MPQNRVITVENRSSHTMWVTVTSQKVVERETEDSQSSSSSSDTSVGHKTGASVNAEGAGVSSEQELNLAHRQSQSSSSTHVRKYDWSPFITAGEAELAPGQKEEFKVTDSTYYVTVRRAPESFWRMNVPKDTETAKVLLLGDNGYWDPVGEKISNGDRVYLRHASGKLTTPVHTHGMWNVANLGASAATHVILATDGSTDEISHEEIVRFRVQSPIDPAKKFLFHGAYDNLYYENDARDSATTFRILLTDLSRGRALRSGMPVQIRGERWSKFMTAENGAGLIWAKCKPAHGNDTEWTLHRHEEPELPTQRAS